MGFKILEAKGKLECQTGFRHSAEKRFPVSTSFAAQKTKLILNIFINACKL